MTLYVLIRLIRLSQPVMPFLSGNTVTRTAFAQFSAHPSFILPWHLSSDVTLEEIRSAASLSFNELLHQLAYGETQQGAPANSLNYPLAIGWGRRDLECFPASGTASLGIISRCAATLV